MSHLAMMFEFPTYMDISRAKMNVVREELDLLKALWAVVKEKMDAFAEFNKTLFSGSYLLGAALLRVSGLLALFSGPIRAAVSCGCL